MHNIMWKLGQISGTLEGLALMEGCTITSGLSALLMGSVEMLESIANELADQNTGANKKASGGFIRMDE